MGSNTFNEYSGSFAIKVMGARQAELLGSE